MTMLLQGARNSAVKDTATRDRGGLASMLMIVAAVVFCASHDARAYVYRPVGPLIKPAPHVQPKLVPPSVRPITAYKGGGAPTIRYDPTFRQNFGLRTGIRSSIVTYKGGGHASGQLQLM